MAFNIQNVTPYERSSHFSERRRSLFPQNNSTDSGEDSDLGCMSPLSNSSFDKSDELSYQSSNNIDDYDVIGIVSREISITPEVTTSQDEQFVITTPNFKATDQSLTSSLQKDIVSESEIQKTPHDTLSLNSKLPKLSHKSVTDSCSSVPSKRKLSPYSSPENPNISPKFDIKNSKVRTTLFPEIELFLPTKKFYSNSDLTSKHKIELSNSRMDQIAKCKISVPCASLNSRKKHSSKRNSAGKINAGVKHNIRRPKPKRNTSLPLAKSAMNETQGNALRYYLENLRELKQTIDNKEKLILNNKENIVHEVTSAPSSSMELSMTDCNVNISPNFKNSVVSTNIAFSCKNTLENVTNIPQSLPKEQEQFLNFKPNSANHEHINNPFSHNQTNNSVQVPFNPFASNFSFTSETCSKPPVDTELSKKRPLSPVNDEPDQNKKFFKFSRSHKGVVSMNESIKLVVDHGKVSLLDRGKLSKHDNGDVSLTSFSLSKNPVLQETAQTFEQEDFTVDEPIMSQVVMDNILSSLDETADNIKKNLAYSVLPEPQKINQCIQPSTSSLNLTEASQIAGSNVAASAAAAENLILSPISQMCDVTSGLALNSPKRVKNLSSLMDTLTRSISKNELLLPKGSMLCKKKPLSLAAKKFRKLHKDQMLLDAGQKKFGVTQCPECDFVYHVGDPSDETCHMTYHEAVPVFKFTGWKNERVVADFLRNGRIIQINASDPKLWLKRVSNLMEVINRELGCHHQQFSLDTSKIFLYIKNRLIAGCLVAVPTSTGYKMLSVKAHESDLCSERCFPVKCGVAQIWVSQKFRKQGIATALMNALKNNFFFGYILNNNEIAFSSPTDMGKAFAKKYFGTPNFMIYFP